MPSCDESDARDEIRKAFRRGVGATRAVAKFKKVAKKSNNGAAAEKATKKEDKNVASALFHAGGLLAAAAPAPVNEADNRQRRNATPRQQEQQRRDLKQEAAGNNCEQEQKQDKFNLFKVKEKQEEIKTRAKKDEIIQENVEEKATQKLQRRSKDKEEKENLHRKQNVANPRIFDAKPNFEASSAFESEGSRQNAENADNISEKEAAENQIRENVRVEETQEDNVCKTKKLLSSSHVETTNPISRRDNEEKVAKEKKSKVNDENRISHDEKRGKGGGEDEKEVGNVKSIQDQNEGRATSILPELQTASSMTSEDVTSETASVASLKMMPPRSALYGAVQLLTQLNQAVMTVDKGFKPIIHLCHDVDDVPKTNEAKKTPKLQRLFQRGGSRSKAADEKVAAFIKAKSSNSEGSDDEESNSDNSNDSWQSGGEDVDKLDYAWMPPQKSQKRKCSKHSQCHCYLFSLDTVGFYALTS